MNTLSKTLIALSLGLFAVAPAFASHDRDRALKGDSLFAQLERQQYCIDQGVRNHQLTREEAKSLHRQQREIHSLLQRFYRDGFLSQKERRLLERELHESERQIKRLKHNDLERYVDLHQRYGYGNHARRL